MTLTAPPELVIGFVLALVRASAWLVIVPPFNTRGIPSQVKIGFAAALALPAAQHMSHTPPPVEIVPLVGAIVLQVAMGLALGFFTLLLFSAVQTAGDLIDLFSGFGAAQLIDPLSGNRTSVFGRFYQLLAVMLLFALNGHLLIVKGFLTSFDVVSTSLPGLEGLVQVVMKDLGMFMLAAVEIGAPILGALFLSEVAMGLLSRAAPQMNVFLLGLPFKILLTLLLAGLALPLLPDAVSSLVDQSVRSGTHLVHLFGGG